MPFYYDLHKLERVRSQRTAAGLIRLKDTFADPEKGVPERVRSSRILLATWNIREFESEKAGPRQLEALYYIAEIIDQFDVVAIQEVRQDLTSLEAVMDILGSWWQYLLTDVTEGHEGNLERMAFVYDTRKIRFGGLAGEVVVPPVDKAKPAPQYARTPFLVGFRTAWFKFTVCTAHMYYDTDKPDDRQRLKEVDLLAKRLASEAGKPHAWARNMIVLGDFNIFTVQDETFKALQKHGFQVHPKLIATGSNVDQTKHFDQIAFIAPDLKDQLEECHAGVFNYYECVYRLEDEAVYAADVPRTQSGKPGNYKQWRTFQMSDHLPVWIELRVDFSREYLTRLATGQRALMPLSEPTKR